MRCRSIRIYKLFAAVAMCLLAIVLLAAPGHCVAAGQDRPAAEATKATEPAAAKPAAKKDSEKETEPTPTNPGDATAPLKRLLPEYDVWIDPKNKQVVIDGEVCLMRGLLEMFACLKGSKEHESVVAANTKAYAVHAALLALGAKSGSPAKWEPKYQSATGTPIDIDVYWPDATGQPQKTKAQNWVRDIKTKKPLKFSWVFAGSAFHRDDTGKQHYLSDASGDFICVSNFPSAMLDLPIESSQTNDELAFEVFSENVPPRGTKVKLVLIPKLEKKADAAAKGADAEVKQKDIEPKEK